MARRRGSVSRTIDTGRAGEALARPGMDTRNWCLQATITGFKLDEEQGPLADVELLPDGDPETVRLGSFYAGDGFGFYAPLEIGDLVLVSFPNGDYDAGGIITGVVWGPAQPPSKTATDNPGDVCLHVKKDTTCRIKVFGEGNVAITCDDGAKVLLGDETGTKKNARIDDHAIASGSPAGTPPSAPSAMTLWMTQVETAINAIATGAVAPLSGTFAGVADVGIAAISQGSDKVESS